MVGTLRWHGRGRAASRIGADRGSKTRSDRSLSWTCRGTDWTGLGSRRLGRRLLRRRLSGWCWLRWVEDCWILWSIITHAWRTLSHRSRWSLALCSPLWWSHHWQSRWSRSLLYRSWSTWSRRLSRSWLSWLSLHWRCRSFSRRLNWKRLI